MPRESIAKKVIPDDLSGVQIVFTDGKTLSVSLDELSDEIKLRLMLHGISQKVGDSYSGEKNLEVALAKATKVKEHLVSNNWKAIREGGSGGRITDLAQALSRVTNRSIAESVEIIDGLGKEGKSELRKHPDIKLAMTEIAAERAREAAQKAAPVDIAAIVGNVGG